MALGYFFDTYAVIELIEGNVGYARYQDETAALTVFNLAEVYWVVLNRLGKKKQTKSTRIIEGQWSTSVMKHSKKLSSFGKR